MKITKKQLRRIIREEKARLHELVTGSQEWQAGDSEADFWLEELASMMATAYQDYVLQQEFEGTQKTWNTEVQNATQRLYEELLGPGVMDKVVATIDRIDQDLHDGQFA